MAPTRYDLSTGWTLKETGDISETWLPVEKVPSQVHIDLLANNVYVITVPFPNWLTRSRNLSCTLLICPLQHQHHRSIPRPQRARSTMGCRTRLDISSTLRDALDQ